ncbi:hypothetical protein [Streptomyces sp. KL116D]|uniref:hypothetical protein n=1 Tax=Streptomyces sp. KL116D TaxID=3045152 RepID=UPI003557572E
MSFDPNDYVFAKRLTVPRRVLLDASGASTLFAQFTVAGGGLSAASAVTFGVSATGATVLVNTADAALDGIKVVSQRRPAAHRHPARRRCDRCEHQPVHDARRRPDISSYGINLTTGSATVTDPAISGVATGITATAASTASGIAIKGGTVSGATSGISLGTATAPAVTGTTVTNTATTGTGIDLANSSSATLTSPTVTGFSRGIGASTTSTAPGPTIDAARVTGAGREGHRPRLHRQGHRHLGTRHRHRHRELRRDPDPQGHRRHPRPTRRRPLQQRRLHPPRQRGSRPEDPPPGGHRA